MKYPFCPHCNKNVRVYGLPYGLQIGSSNDDECTDVQGVILIQCSECGSVLAAYKDEKLDK